MNEAILNVSVDGMAPQSLFDSSSQPYLSNPERTTLVFRVLANGPRLNIVMTVKMTAHIAATVNDLALNRRRHSNIQLRNRDGV